MGLYAIDCPTCDKPFMWFSGNMDQRCGDCQKEGNVKKQAMIKFNNTYFRLSDGFKGSVADALREMADYFDSKTDPLPKNKHRPDEDDGWLCFLEIVDNGGRFSGVVGIDTLIKGKLGYQTGDGKWKRHKMKFGKND